MEKCRQIVAVFMVVIIITLLTAGCSVRNKGKLPSETVADITAPANEETTGAPYNSPMEISIATWGIGEALSQGPDEVRDTVYKKLNILLKPVNVTWSDYKDKIMIWSASSQLPDMFAYDAVGIPTYKEWINQGIIKALPDDLSAYPNVRNIMAEETTNLYRSPANDENGKFYAIPRINHKNKDDWSCDIGIQIRKDWMEEVGVTKDPVNMDEFIELMLKFVNDDPDGNGKKDTIGLTCYDATFLRSILLSYEPDYEGWTRDPENPGKWIPGFMTKNFLAGLKDMHRLYAAGGMDKDFAMLKGEEGEDKLAGGIAGAYAHDVTPATLIYLANKYEKLNPGKRYEDAIKILKPLMGPGGKYYRLISLPFWSETYFNSKISDEKLDRGIRLIDYFLSDEGYNLLHYGIRDKDWKIENGAVKLIPHKDESGKEIPFDKLYPFVKLAFFAEWSGTRQWTGPSMRPELQQMSKEQHEWLMANAIPGNENLMIGYLDIPSGKKASVQIADIVINCILNEDVEATWNRVVNDLLNNGYRQIIKETNEEIIKAGIK